MSRKIRRIVIVLLVWCVIILPAIEIGLRIFDPWGLVYFIDQEVLGLHISPDEQRGYRLDPGVYRLAHWTTTELDGGLRAVPGDYFGACRVVFLGDSVTWGYGVSDGETFVSLIARETPTITALNPAYYAYNSENVLGVYRDFPTVDAYIYLIMSNDVYQTRNLMRRPSLPGTGMIVRYIEQASGRLAWPLPKDEDRFYRDMDALARDERVTFAAFDEPWGQELARRYPVHLIPMYTHQISKIDSHPDAAGNREIAAAMLPIVKDAVTRACTAIL